MIPLNKNIQILFGSNELVEEKIVPFDTSLLEEVAQFSNFLFAKKPSAEIVAFAFWCRRSNLINLSRAYTQSMGEGNHKVFHITPANVDISKFVASSKIRTLSFPPRPSITSSPP